MLEFIGEHFGGYRESNGGGVIAIIILVILLVVVAWLGWNHEYKMKTNPAYAAEYNKQQAEWRAAEAKRAAQREDQLAKRELEKRLAVTPFVDKSLAGQHLLRKMGSQNSHTFNSSADGSLFLLFGSYKSMADGKDELIVRFSWERDNGLYINSELPFTKVRQKLDENASEPSITFVWQEHPAEVSEDREGCWSPKPLDENSAIKGCLAYAVITCKPDDWARNVKLPLN